MEMNNRFLATERPSHIINLGYCILQHTQLVKEKAMVKLVHEFSRRDILEA